MNISILSIGDEILLGKIENINTSYIAKQLNLKGFKCVCQMSVADNEYDICNALDLLSTKSSLIICTGGLGLTDDDMTKQVVAKYVGSELIYSEEAEKITDNYYKNKNIKVTTQLKSFNTLPKDCIILHNETGVACGFIVQRNNIKIAVFPGPPVEMRPMFDNYFTKYLEKFKDENEFTQTFKIFGVRELEVFNHIKDFLPLENSGIVLTTYCTNQEVSLVMRYKESISPSIVDKVILDISNTLGKNIYSFSNEELQDTVYGLLKIKNKKIAVAESITGGKIADKLISVAGISKYLVEDIVTYSNESKIARLMVNAETIEKEGAVSEKTAYEMCKGLLINQKVDIAISTTGDAGPSVEPLNNEVGRCFIGIGMRDNIRVFEHKFYGDREQIRDSVSKQALYYLINLLKYNEI